jgi:hypothetical protein
MKHFILYIVLFFVMKTQAQELFVVTEPASNMPTGSIGVRMAQSLMKENFENGYNYHLMPEIMWGANKNLMLHTSFFVSNRNDNLVIEGGSIYGKYRFFSVDDFHSHFRMAVFGRYSLNYADIHQEQIETMGHNSGFETGIIATQLINKLAISSSISFEKAVDNGTHNPFPEAQSNAAINYTLSFGKLVYPKKYTNFKQTNINLMLEFEGQTLLQNQKSYLEVVPSIQFIINSQARIDIAYQQELYRTMTRTASNGVYLKLEYTFFNVVK